MQIAMIDEHSEDGKVTPLRLRVKENGEYQSFKVIDPVLYDKQRTPSKNTILRYKAKIEVDSIIKNIELYYCLETCRWEMKI